MKNHTFPGTTLRSRKGCLITRPLSDSSAMKEKKKKDRKSLRSYLAWHKGKDGEGPDANLKATSAPNSQCDPEKVCLERKNTFSDQ